MSTLPIGTTKGPGETPHEYTFVAPDPQQQVKYGEFVYYEADVDGQTQRILSRVTRRVPLRLYPDTFMADPTIPPSALAELLGFAQEAPTSDPASLFEITATILGYYHSSLGFVNPRVPPRAGAPIYIAPDEMLAEVLSRSRPGEVGAVHIGSLLSRSPDAVPIVLDARGFTSTHLAIIASTGAGKSYLAAVMIEELMKPNNRAAVLIIDPHAEYDTLAELQGKSLFDEETYEPQVRIYRPDQIKVRVSSLDIGDLRYLLPNLSERMHHYLGRAYGRVQRQYKDKWTKEQLIVAVRAGADESPITDPESDSKDDPTIGALIWRIESVLGSRVFDNFQSLPLQDLFRPGQCTILQLNEIPEREQQIIVATLLRRLWQARQDTVRGRAIAGEENYLPYPAFVLIEEAHNFAPAAADLVTTQILKQILSEGRKFGVAVGLISQRPGKLDSDVLSQCMTQCIMRIVNPVDQARVAESIESVGRDLLLELPALSKGQVIVAGASVNTPVMVRVRQRETPHGAEDLNAPKEWLAYFSAQQERQRERDNAPPGLTRRGANPLYRGST
ncbi:MAG: ATP-binding protein [Chloroflexi bacterium]|nr:ATP-binding protein [Chloroflexota bacterium]